MEATEILQNEHRVIETVLTGLDRLAHQAEMGKPFDRDQAEKALEILSNFADRCHHGKEEHHLFRLMQERGMPADEGPIAVMLHEHDLGREHIRAMREALSDATANDPQAVRTFAQHAHGYTELLRQHIIKEDTVLYPMAERFLKPEDDQVLVREFDRVEQEEMGEGVHERYHQWANELAEGEEVTATSSEEEE